MCKLNLRLRNLSFYLILGCLTACYSLSVHAHGSIHERLTETSEAIKREPNNIDQYRHRIELWVEHQQFDKALADLDKIISIKTDYNKIEFIHAWVLFNQSLHLDKHSQVDLQQRAEGLLASHLARNPTDYSAHYLMAQVLSFQNNHKQAAKHFESTLALNPTPELEMVIGIAESYQQLGQTDKALAHFRSAHSRLGNNDQLVDAALTLALQEGDAKQGLVWLNRLPTEVLELPSRQIQKGELHLQLKQQKQAAEAFCKASQKLDRLSDRIQKAPRIMGLIEKSALLIKQLEVTCDTKHAS